MVGIAADVLSASYLRILFRDHWDQRQSAPDTQIQVDEPAEVDMGLTWIAIAASLLMGGGALLIFIWAVKATSSRVLKMRSTRFSGQTRMGLPRQGRPRRQKERSRSSGMEAVTKSVESGAKKLRRRDFLAWLSGVSMVGSRLLRFSPPSTS